MNELASLDTYDVLAWLVEPTVTTAPEDPPVILLPPILDGDGYRWAPVA